MRHKLPLRKVSVGFAALSPPYTLHAFSWFQGVQKGHEELQIRLDCRTTARPGTAPGLQMNTSLRESLISFSGSVKLKSSCSLGSLRGPLNEDSV